MQTFLQYRTCVQLSLSAYPYLGGSYIMAGKLKGFGAVVMRDHTKNLITDPAMKTS